MVSLIDIRRYYIDKIVPSKDVAGGRLPRNQLRTCERGGGFSGSSLSLSTRRGGERGRSRSLPGLTYRRPLEELSHLSLSLSLSRGGDDTLDLLCGTVESSLRPRSGDVALLLLAETWLCIELSPIVVEEEELFSN